MPPGWRLAAALTEAEYDCDSPIERYLLTFDATPDSLKRDNRRETSASDWRAPSCG